MKGPLHVDDEVTSPIMDRGNVFGDEYEVDAEDFDGVADGFRPGNDDRPVEPVVDLLESRDQGEIKPEIRPDDMPIRTVSAHYSSRPVTPSAPSRNSMRKSRTLAYQPDPFASPEDDDDFAEPVDGLQFEPDSDGIRRSMSTVSSRMFARTHSPRLSSTGPSHPYGMYQQGTMPRSPSIASTSIVRPLDRRSLSLRNGPQHPYSMYTQGVDEHLDDGDESNDEQQALQRTPLPIGFPGLGQSYTRRRGPDGEEQDIIGEDGHTEQLPPYSRYPDEAPEKVPLLVPTALHSRAPVAGTDPTMELMHTALQPSARQSMMDSSSRLSNRPTSMASLERLRSGSDYAYQPPSKNWKDASWKEKAKIKFCGIPFWCYMLALIIITLIATVLGSVIGNWAAHRPHNNPWNDKTVTYTTSLIDASIIASPTSQAPYTGTYALTLGPPQATQAACLVNQDQQIAWDCNIVPEAELAIIVGTNPDTPQEGAQIVYAADIEIMYGSQASYMNTTFSTFLTVTDTDDVSAGPAFYFTALYDKVVVLPEDAFNPFTKKFKRDALPIPNAPVPPSYSPEQWIGQKQVAKASDKPWFCVWNGTLLEGFIYVDQNSNWTGTPTGPYPTTTATSSIPTVSSSMSITGSPSTLYTSSRTASTSAYPITSPAMASSAVPTPTPAPSDPFAAHDGDDGGYQQTGYKRQASPTASSSQLAWSTLPVYPYMVKLEERRLPSNPITPYCQQYQILNNGEANWVGTGPNKSLPIIVFLEEQDPSFSAYVSAGLGKVSRNIRPRADNDTVAHGCHCQWISGGQMPN